MSLHVCDSKTPKSQHSHPSASSCRLLYDFHPKLDHALLTCDVEINHLPGLEFIEEEVVEMMRGVDVDGSDSIEWKVRGFTSSVAEGEWEELPSGHTRKNTHNVMANIQQQDSPRGQDAVWECTHTKTAASCLNWASCVCR